MDALAILDLYLADVIHAHWPSDDHVYLGMIELLESVSCPLAQIVSSRSAAVLARWAF